MATYIIGDVQGCFDALTTLLEKIQFDATKDQLGFVGDLVNRGPKSLETLRFIAQLKNPIIVLGNHDLHLMALYFSQHQSDFKHIPHTLSEILEAPDCDALIDFLLQQPFLFLDTKNNFVVAHAGIPPQWSIANGCDYAHEAKNAMRDNPEKFFQNIYGDLPAQWRDDLSGFDRVRYIVNAFTRMRFCTQAGELDLKNKTDRSSDAAYRPWFEWYGAHLKTDIVFGHWASLQGQCTHPHIFALDTGCVWGGKLTALRVEGRKRVAV